MTQETIRVFGSAPFFNEFEVEELDEAIYDALFEGEVDLFTAEQIVKGVAFVCHLRVSASEIEGLNEIRESSPIIARFSFFSRIYVDNKGRSSLELKQTDEAREKSGRQAFRAFKRFSQKDEN